ncbi:MULTISPECIES: sialate O-acetylesterase [unclassified Spirosoma]|uniref:sialate O-acetylesterase n=1 Tax=unclassified Spirosoma TaxID=2621999 RepID=UPI001AD24E24|nr:MULTISPECIES: sialate O-acetylesterase [unclassified Spirosoma]MBN8823279.1 sialate O-acetylesterase [Spirosoma sp.]
MKTIVFFLLALAARAEVSLPSILGSNMVLQQQTDVAIWGWGSPPEKIIVTASWDNRPISVTCSDDATWKVRLRTPAAGGPHTITIAGSSTIQLTNILIGEVWLCSGQSNMGLSAAGGVKDAQAELPQAFNPSIRLFKMTKRSSPVPQDDVKGRWQICDSASLKAFSAVGYFFGKKLHAGLNVPIGLIDMSWGATKIESWMPEALAMLYPETRHSIQMMPQNQWAPAKAGWLYNGMVAPITSFAIAGVIWYQGESNRHYAPAYYRLMHLLIEGWRGLWQTDFPFYYVQLAPYRYGGKFETPLLREAQANAMDIPKTGMVVTTDLADNLDDVHPIFKKEVGNRLANWALAENYKRPVIAYKSPKYRSMQIRGSVIRLTFDQVPNGFMSTGNELTEFGIAGIDQVFVKAKARIVGNEIEVWAESVKTPVAVRFAFRDAPEPNLFSREGLPVIPFRTDNWDLGLTKF